MSKVIETRPICVQKNKYTGWPTIAKAPDGTLHAVFSGDRDAHICPFGKSYLISSNDGGVSWTEPRVINNTPLDDRDTGMCITPDGTMILSWFTSHYYRAYEVNCEGYLLPESKYHTTALPWSEWEKVVKEVSAMEAGYWAPFLIRPTTALAEKWAKAWVELGVKSSVEYDPRFPAATRRLGFWTRRSTDGGKTWDDATLSPVMAPHGPNMLSDGRLIFVGQTASWYDDIAATTSPDNGLTWNVTASINSKFKLPDGSGAYLGEPHVVQAASGKLVALARFQAKLKGEERFLYQFDSHDEGATWTEPKPSTLNGYPPHLLRTSDNRLLASFSVRHEPFGFRFCFSSDEGQTWDVQNQLHVHSEHKDLGYPATAEISPGNFVSVYYQNIKEAQKPCLMMTRWQG